MILIVIRVIVHIYDIITLPIYAILQKPWIRWSKSRALKGRQLDPNDPYSPWVGLRSEPKHFTDECLTVDEVIEKSIDINGRNNKCLGYREVIEEQIEYSDGKPITKYVLSDYKWITYDEFDERVSNIGKGLVIKGVKSGDNVMIFADTSIDWFICAQSILRIGGTVATLYSSLNDEGIIHGMNETEVTHVLTSHQLLSKLVRLKNKIPKMSTIIYLNTNISSDLNMNIIEKSETISTLNIISLSDLEETAKLMATDQQLTYRRPKEDDIAVLLYTSGSTGVPKGVKISHKNMLKMISAIIMFFEQDMAGTCGKTYIAYLPLSHIFEMVVQHSAFIFGIKIGYSSPNTLTDMGTAIRKGDKGDATLLKPTLMIGVPLVLDRIRKGIYDKINKNGLIARKIFEFLVEYKYFWSQKGFDTPIINRVFCQKFRESVGGKLSIIVSGGAALSQDTHKIIKSCFNINLVQGYGISETCGPNCCMDIFDESLGRIGPPFPHTQIRLIDWDEGGYRVNDKPNPRGEIVIGGEYVSVGYYKRDEETNASFYTDSDGLRWFITGDIGEVFPDGTFKIIDRKKDLIKLQFGEYVSLGKIESEYKSNSFVDNICVFGHLYHSYLVVLIVPNQLSVINLAKRLKVDYNSLNDLCENQCIVDYITNEIRSHGLNACLSKHEIPQKLILCSEEWTPDNGLLTASMKIKRKNITNKYQKQIDLMYDI